MLRDGTYIHCYFGSTAFDAKLLHLPNRDSGIRGDGIRIPELGIDSASVESQ